MKDLDAKTLAALRAELQDLLESAYAAGSDDGESDLIKMFYSGKADAYETALSLINVALNGDPDDAE
ncbi:hypothetical protein [Dialister succinatiphilus]|uniref:hypothetical protein n=1 Tax=Dialister succinatiphilus TaxID=487173 RepID=UPI003F7F6694